MVKHLQITAKVIKLIVLGLLLVLIWGAVWLQSAIHRLDFAKPWILASLNPEDAAYTVTFDTLTIDWRQITELGQLRITDIRFAHKNGADFIALPEVYATIDVLGFLPRRNMVHTITVHGAHLMVARDMEKRFFIGMDGAGEPMPLDALTTSSQDKEPATIRLPFRRLVMDRAIFHFKDEVTGETLSSENAELRIGRRRGHYRGQLNLPYTSESGDGVMQLSLNPKGEDYRLNLQSPAMPGKFVCAMADCPEKTWIDGPLDIEASLNLKANGQLTAAAAKMAAAKATLTAPSWFSKPVPLSESSVTLVYDAQKHTVLLPQITLGLEHTAIAAEVNAAEREDGWYIDAKARLTRPLQVTELHRYWPLFMAPDTRDWVTSKLKAGHAEQASMHLMLKPTDLGEDDIADDSLSADVDARDITIDYLPNFPYIHHMNGAVHFTGTTVKIEGGGGTLLEGGKITKAMLWCPDLNDVHIPMEVELEATTPIKDAITFLKLKHFTFDDPLTLDATKATGSGSVAMKLAFDSFSGKGDPKSDEINLEGVKYDIHAHINEFAQTGVYGGYTVKSLSGDLNASDTGLKFTGLLGLGDSPVSAVTLSQYDGKPLELTVKTQTAQSGKPANDFSLSYKSGAIPTITVKGAKLDATADYAGSETSSNSLLSNFPAMRLDVNLNELYVSPSVPFTRVSANLYCTPERCESARLRANTGRGTVNGGISRINGGRNLQLTANDAGAFLKALDVTDRMTRGRLELRGGYNETKRPPQFNGRLLIQDFTLKNSQILGRILSIGSLTGLSNALTGSGIAFEKLSANLVAHRGVITVDEGRANGNAMGITFNGTVDTSTTKLGLKGVVVPAYALNSLLSNVPILGKIAGGKGEGLIAFNYSVGGTYANPDVGVNPLSGLTPGFLRGIFGIFDQPESAKDTTSAPKEENAD